MTAVRRVAVAMTMAVHMAPRGARPPTRSTCSSWRKSACCRNRISRCSRCSARCGHAEGGDQARRAGVGQPEGDGRSEAAVDNIGDRCADAPREGRRHQRPGRVGVAGDRTLRQAIVSSAGGAYRPSPATTGGRPPPSRCAAGLRSSSPRRHRTTPPNRDVSPQRMYDASYDDYSTGRFDMAIQGFQGFIQSFPRMQPMVADAQYNIGIAVRAEQRRKLVAAYQRVISVSGSTACRSPITSSG